MNPHNDLLHKGCPKSTSRIMLAAGGIIVIAVCVLLSIAVLGVD